MRVNRCNRKTKKLHFKKQNSLLSLEVVLPPRLVLEEVPGQVSSVTHIACSHFLSPCCPEEPYRGGGEGMEGEGGEGARLVQTGEGKDVLTLSLAGGGGFGVGKGGLRRGRQFDFIKLSSDQN